MSLCPLQPVITAGLFRPLNRHLIALLRGLDTRQWATPTSAGGWTVHEVAAHLLHGDLRKLSGWDAEPTAPTESDFARIVGAIDADNARGVEFLSALSPRVLTDLLEVTGRDIVRVFAALPPDAPARTSVAWAGEAVSANWTDIGREFTERFHHQVQIRDAVGAPPLADRRFVSATLRLGVLALRRAFASLGAEPGTSVVLSVAGGWSHSWSIVRGADGWQLSDGAAAEPTAKVTTDAETAWRSLFGLLTAEEARARSEVAGDAVLAARVFAARSVMVREATEVG